jgi:hypothetical protein
MTDCLLAPLWDRGAELSQTRGADKVAEPNNVESRYPCL